jgi:hypothetical protein
MMRRAIGFFTVAAALCLAGCEWDTTGVEDALNESCFPLGCGGGYSMPGGGATSGPPPRDSLWSDEWVLSLKPDTLTVPADSARGRSYFFAAVSDDDGMLCRDFGCQQFTWYWKIDDSTVAKVWGQLPDGTWGWSDEFTETWPTSKLYPAGINPGVTRVTVSNKFGASAHATLIVY